MGRKNYIQEAVVTQQPYWNIIQWKHYNY